MAADGTHYRDLPRHPARRAGLARAQDPQPACPLRPLESGTRFAQPDVPSRTDLELALRPTLVDQHAEVLELLSWINPVFRDTVVLVDRFPTVYRQGSHPCRARRTASSRVVGSLSTAHTSAQTSTSRSAVGTWRATGLGSQPVEQGVRPTAAIIGVPPIGPDVVGPAHTARSSPGSAAGRRAACCAWPRCGSARGAPAPGRTGRPTRPPGPAPRSTPPLAAPAPRCHRPPWACRRAADAVALPGRPADGCHRPSRCSSRCQGSGAPRRGACVLYTGGARRAAPQAASARSDRGHRRLMRALARPRSES